MLSDSSSSNIVFQGKMKITTRLGQFTHGQSKVIEIAKAISSLLEESKNSPEMYDYLMYLVAKQIVKQSEKEVAVKQDLAFPIAIFCCMLLEKHKPFKDILLGKLIQRCPYIVPMYIKKGSSSDEEYRKNLGYIKTDEKYETEIQYQERMCGILALYAAILQTTALPHSYGIENGWRWLARILNMPPRRITPLLLLTFLEITGFMLYKTFPQQMPKLMQLLIKEYIPRMPEASIASTTRLKLFLEENVLKRGTLPEPPGRDLTKK
jgi:hypothetical protein